MTAHATLVAHARLTDLERSILALMVDRGEWTGTTRELSEANGVNRSSLFRALNTLVSGGIIMRSSVKGRSGSIALTFSTQSLDVLRRLCDHLGRCSERAGVEYTPVRKEDESRVRADRARFMEAKRARQIAALWSAQTREVGQG